MADQPIAELFLDLLNVVDQEDQEEQGRVTLRSLTPQRRFLRDALDPFSLPPNYFKKYYRMTPECMLILIGLLKTRLMTERSTGIPPHIQVLIAIRFMAEGQYQRGLSQDFFHPVSQSSACKCIQLVIEAILGLADKFIKFPMTVQERHIIQNRFQRTMRVPGILGIVDGFLVTFKRSAVNEEAFHNYRVGSSMNVQMIVDSDYNILNVRVCPGSNNDRFVWQFSEAKRYMESLRNNQNVLLEGRYYILGDSGYTPSPILLTPYLNAVEGSPASVYNREFVGTRRIVEQTIGIVTNTWQAIKRFRKLHYHPEKVSKLIYAACILHNFRLRHGIFDEVPQRNVNFRNVYEERNNDYQVGIAERNHIIQEYYA